MDYKVLILYEPTSSLDDKEVEMLFSLMRNLKSRGMGNVTGPLFGMMPLATINAIVTISGLRGKGGSSGCSPNG